MATRTIAPRFAALALVAALAATVAPGAAGDAAGDRGADASVIVQGASRGSLAAAVQAAGGEVTDELGIIGGVAATVPGGRLAALRAAPGVSAVSPNEAVQVAGVTPAHRPSAVYPKVVKAHRLWRDGVTGTGVGVAVIDTGIARVPDLADRVVAGIDFSTDADPYRDGFGHGTFVAGMIAGDGTASGGRYKGVAPDVDLVSLKVAGETGAATIVEVIKALQATIVLKPLHNIRVVNLSLGTDSDQPYMLSPLNQAVERVWDAGIVVVVSASNLGTRGPGSITKPADDPLVITVGAIDDMRTGHRRDDAMAGFSGLGPTQDGFSKPDVVASGRSVLSLRVPGSTIDTLFPSARFKGSYFRGSGTSFASGVVSGAAALLLQDEPLLTPDQVKARFADTARPGPAGDPNVDGAGTIDVYRAAGSTSLRSANRNVVRSLGTGTLADDCGSLCEQVHVEGVTDLGTRLPVDLTDPNWAGSTWYGSTWYDSDWTGSTWYDQTWAGSTWYGSTWYGSTWYGSTWYGKPE